MAGSGAGMKGQHSGQLRDFRVYPQALDFEELKALAAGSRPILPQVLSDEDQSLLAVAEDELAMDECVPARPHFSRARARGHLQDF